MWAQKSGLIITELFAKVMNSYVRNKHPDGKWIKMVNFKLGNETWEVNWSQNLSPRQESNPWPPDVQEVMGSIPVGGSDFLFLPRSCRVDQFTFHISLPSLKFTIFIHLTHSRWLWQCWSLQYAGHLSHMNSFNWSCSPRVLIAQWIERPPGVHGFTFCWGLRFS